MWCYVHKIPSLEQKAAAQVAINLCQENSFKEVALRLEKPTYFNFIRLYESDLQKLPTLAKVRVDDRFCDFIQLYHPDGSDEKVRQWDTAIDKQCQRLTEGIPRRLRQKIQPWLNRIALEYLSYSRRQEVLFGVSRYFLMNTLTRGDWKETGRLDEMKLAQRLLEDERLTVLQRYRMSCVHCLHVHIPQLWERLTQEEKQFNSGRAKYGNSEKTHRLVLLWSWYMNSNEDYKVEFRKKYQWPAVSRDMPLGNCAVLMGCWNEFPENIRRKIVIDRALDSLQQWQSAGESGEFHVKRKLVSRQSPEEPSAFSIEDFNPPSCYSELMFFFLSRMDQEQQLTFFNKAFQSKYRKSVLECFLEWPHQDDFLQTVNQLWGIIPKDKYVLCLLTLASKYSEIGTNANSGYDYRSLLRALWEETPEEYKQYVFCDRETPDDSVINEGKELLSQLVERSPFQEKDEALFKLIFRYQPQDQRRAMMHSSEGRDMCMSLIQKEKLFFLNELLEECLSKEEIPDFKKRLILSYCGVNLCLDALKKNREKLVEDLLNWFLESDAEKTQYKDKLIEKYDCFHVCESLLCKGKFAEVERVINFCLSSDEKKERFKVHVAERACVLLYSEIGSGSEDCVWEQMDTIITWSVDTEEKIRSFKKDLFSRDGIDIHYRLVLHETLWGEIKCFYQWFGLSPKEIKKLKRDTLFTPRFIEYIHENLSEHTNTLVDSLRLCLTDEKMVINLKKKVKEYCKDVSDERREIKKAQLNHLVSELLDGFRK